MERVLIAGCGYVGSALAARLAADGDEVWGMRRTPAGLPAGVRPLAADLRDPATLAGLPEGLTTVFYTAAADGGSEDDYRAVYVDGPRNLLAALAAQGQRPRRVIFTSSTSVYGQSGGEWVDEDSPAEPAGFRGRRMPKTRAATWGCPYEGCRGVNQESRQGEGGRDESRPYDFGPHARLAEHGLDLSAQESPFPSLRAKDRGEAGTVRRSVQEVVSAAKPSR